MQGAVAAAKVADPFGHPIHLALAMAYAFVLPLDMVPPAKDFVLVGLLIFTLLRLPKIFRCYGPIWRDPLTWWIVSWPIWLTISLSWTPLVEFGAEEIRAWRMILIPSLFWPVMVHYRLIVGAFLAGCLSIVLYQLGQLAGMYELGLDVQGRADAGMHPILAGSLLSAGSIWFLSGIYHWNGTRSCRLRRRRSHHGHRIGSHRKSRSLDSGCRSVARSDPGDRHVVATLEEMHRHLQWTWDPRPGGCHHAGCVRPLWSVHQPGAESGRHRALGIPGCAERRLILDGQRVVSVLRRLSAACMGSCQRVFEQHPVIGSGAGGIAAYLDEAWWLNEPEKGSRGIKIQIQHLNPHSMYLQVLASTGIVGLVLILVPMVMSFIRLVRRIGDPVYCGAGFVLVSWAVGSIFDSYQMVGTQVGLLMLVYAASLAARPRYRTKEFTS